MENTAVERKQIHVSILGSCVSRDAFSLSQSAADYRDTGVDYVVDRFVQSIHPLSAISAPVDATLAERLIGEARTSQATNFYKRNFLLDVTKGWDAYLSEVRSDWLILDLSIVRFALRPVGESWITNDLEIAAAKGLSPEDAPAITALKERDLMETVDLREEELEPILEKYLQRILALYPAERIIVLDVRHVSTYVDPVTRTVATPSAVHDRRCRKEDRVIDIAYRSAKRHLRGAHFVDALPLLVGNVGHVWGRCGLHYLDEVYLYFLRAIGQITCGEGEESGNALAALREDFSKKVLSLYVSAANRTAEHAASVLPRDTGLCEGTFEKNGLTVTVGADRCYTVTGNAEEDTVLYLLSRHGNPVGEWASLPVALPAGSYRITTDVAPIPEQMAVQLALSDKEKNQRWFSVDVARRFSIPTDAVFALVRMTVKAGTRVEVCGRLVLEHI